MKIAVIPPCVFPSLEYFQVVRAVDFFIFYDDDHFINGGGTNRILILRNHKAQLVTFPCSETGSHRMLHDVIVDNRKKAYSNLVLTIQEAYKNAPYFNAIYPLVVSIIDKDFEKLTDLASFSVKSISHYLRIPTNFCRSSKKFKDSAGQATSDRVIRIAKELGSKHQVSTAGGKAVYDREYFKTHGIKLSFLRSRPTTYTQFNNAFVPDLSIIDVLMFNSYEKCQRLLKQYKLS